jgi:Plasmid maintenance system antidote protein
MKQRGITQKELQAMTGIDQASLSRIINERNKRSITLDTCKRIAKALGNSIEHIWPD